MPGTAQGSSVKRLGALLSVVAIFLCSCTTSTEPQIGSTLSATTVSKWKDGKRAVYLLSFDDEAPSQLDNVIPALIARQIVGTFYVVTGNDLWSATKAQWDDAAKSPYVVLANHTYTHEGVNGAEELDNELEKNNEVIYGIYSDRPRPFLLSFGQPGGVPWNVTSEQQASALARHNLVERPPFKGSPMNYTTQEELVASVDDAIARGDLGYDDMHGVGGDWLATPVEWFSALLDKLEAEKGQLWIPDVTSYAKYLAERESAAVKIVRASANEIHVALSTKTDPVLYNFPLTLITNVPFGWTTAVVTQGSIKVKVPVINRTVMYDALPSAGDIVIVPFS